jgi:NADH-quinone oxidoreductase subunit E
MSVTTHPKVSSYPAPRSEGFAFDEATWAEARRHLAKYPDDRKASAVLPLLWLAQKQNGNYLTREAVEYVAEVLEMAPIRVHEVAHFYSMFNHKPVGEYFIQVCRTTPCWLRGADDLARTVEDKLGVSAGEVTADGKFSWRYVECLGACCNAPMVQINDWYYEDLTSESLSKLIDDLGAGREVAIGSQQGRRGSEPAGGPDTLTEVGETGHPDYPFGNGADAEPAVVRQAREAAEQTGETSGKE